MNSAYERLCSLFGAMGLNLEKGSYAEAEAYALAAGCEEVSRLIEAIKSRVFVLGEDGEPVLFADMLGLDSAFLQGEELKEYLTKRLSHSFGDCEGSDALFDEFSLIGRITVTPTATANTVSGLTKKGLRFFGALCAGGFPFNKSVKLDWGGMTFDEWDAAALTFRGYDSLRLPFSCIDTLNASLI